MQPSSWACASCYDDSWRFEFSKISPVNVQSVHRNTARINLTRHHFVENQMSLVFFVVTPASGGWMWNIRNLAWVAWLLIFPASDWTNSMVPHHFQLDPLSKLILNELQFIILSNFVKVINDHRDLLFMLIEIHVHLTEFAFLHDRVGVDANNTGRLRVMDTRSCFQKSIVPSNSNANVLIVSMLRQDINLRNHFDVVFSWLLHHLVEVVRNPLVLIFYFFQRFAASRVELI